MTDRVARRVRVSGRVQGVFFRESTRRTARAAGVTGWVRNEPDGTVHAHLEGPADAVARVIGFMRSGPPDAEVGDVRVTDVDPLNGSGFDLA